MSSLSFGVRESLTRAPEETAPGVWEASFVFAPDFSGFNGHFPGDPMLPGVAQIMAAALTASGGRTMRVAHVGRTKFMNMVRPDDAMHVRATVKPSANGLAVTADCVTDAGPCAQIKLVLV